MIGLEMIDLTAGQRICSTQCEEIFFAWILAEFFSHFADDFNELLFKLAFLS